MAEHFCNEHGKVFFKKGKMKGYAHPIEDEDGETVGWCNEDAEGVAKLPAQKVVSPPLQEGEPTPEELKTDKMSKGDWAEKERKTRKSIERQKSLDKAVDWCIAKQTTEPVKTAMVLTVASLFESYLENGVSVEKK